MTPLWSYKWHYFSSIAALIYEECGYVELIRALDHADDALLTRYLAPTQHPSDHARGLISLIRKVVDDIHKHRTDAYDGRWGTVPWKLTLKLRRMEGPLAKEVIVTPDSVILPWPLPARSEKGQAIAAALDAWTQQSPDRAIPPLGADEYDDQQDFRYTSVSLVLETIATEKPIPFKGTYTTTTPGGLSSTHMRQVKSALRQDWQNGGAGMHDMVRDFEANSFPAAYKSWTDFMLPDALRLSIYETRKTTDSYVTAYDDQGTKHLAYDMGWIRHDTIYDKIRFALEDALAQSDEGVPLSSETLEQIVARFLDQFDVDLQEAILMHNPDFYGALGRCECPDLAPPHIELPSTSPCNK